jgi:hypothetical protein
MTNTTLIAIVAVVAIAAVLVAWMYIDRRKRERLKDRFGPEYDKTLRDAGGQRRAESILERREQRVSSYHIRPLTPEGRRRFTDTWRRVQALFVDDPNAAVSQAHTLVTELMTTRGYPMTDFERQAEDLSVDHAAVVHHYREARVIVDRQARKEASTEDLRQVLVHYRALFEDLLETAEPERRRA